MKKPTGSEKTPIAIRQRARVIGHLEEKDANTDISDKFKTEKDARKEILRERHQPVLNENVSENYQFRLENRRYKHVSQEKAVVQKASAEPTRISTSWQNHQTPPIPTSETSSSARVDQRLKLRFDPRRTNTPKLPNKMSESLNIAESTKLKTQIRTKNASSNPLTRHIKTIENGADKDKNNIKRIQLEIKFFQPFSFSVDL